MSIEILERRPLPMSSDPPLELVIARARYSPGGTSSSHEHPGVVVGYVIDGVILSQMTGEPEKRLAAGDVFVETPHAHHAVARNASTEAPATFLLVFVTPIGAPLTVRLP
jgi:quercetin dioxygenase-like cupin family protein